MVSAIQEAQTDNLRSFNDYMMKVLEVCITQQIFGLFNIILILALFCAAAITITSLYLAIKITFLMDFLLILRDVFKLK